MSLKSRIKAHLQNALAPERLEVIDESHHHVGHQPSFDGTGETHMRVRIVSKKFEGMSRLQRHRAVNEALKLELNAGLHALAIEAAAPGEPTRW